MRRVSAERFRRATERDKHGPEDRDRLRHFPLFIGEETPAEQIPIQELHVVEATGSSQSALLE
jgi:hypothetical protein